MRRRVRCSASARRCIRYWRSALARHEGGSAVVDDVHVRHLDAGELRSLTGPVSFENFRLGKRGLTIRDEHRVIGQNIVEELRVWAKFRKPETFF